MAKSGLSKIGSQTFSAAPPFGRLDYNMVPLEQKKYKITVECTGLMYDLTNIFRTHYNLS